MNTIHRENTYVIDISVNESYRVYLDEAHILNSVYDRLLDAYEGDEDKAAIEYEAICSYSKDSNGEIHEYIAESIDEIIQDGWPGYGPTLSEWSDDTKANNGTRNLDSEETEVLSVVFHEKMKKDGKFPA